MGEITLRQMAAGPLDYKQLLRRDLPLALRMVKNGKLRLFPSFGKANASRKAARKREAIAYYPGCSLHGTSSEYDLSARAVLSTLGVAVEEPEELVLLREHAGPFHGSLPFPLSLPLGNVLAMEKEGFDHITTPCPPASSG